MKKRMIAFMGVLFAVFTLFALFGCNGDNNTSPSQTKPTLFIYQDYGLEGEEIKLIRMCTVSGDKIAEIHVPKLQLTENKGRYLYMFCDASQFDGRDYTSGQNLQVLAAGNEIGRYEVTCKVQACTYVAHVFIDGDNTLSLSNYGDITYRFDPRGAIEETEAENGNGKKFVYQYDGATHYPLLKVYYKGKELPCRIEVYARINGEADWETGRHSAEGYVTNVNSYEITYFLTADEEYLNANSMVRTVFESAFAKSVYVEIME